MGRGLRLLVHSAGLNRAVVGALRDHRRRAKKRQLSLRDRADWLHEHCISCLNRMRIDFRVQGEPPASGLIVSNHLSYLDVLIYGAIAPCVFVSKAEVRRWPVFGALATNAGTVYVDRSRRTDTRNANDGIRSALEQGLRVVVFPEGTSSDGTDVLPFYASLLGPAVEAAMPITPAYLSYAIEDGTVARDVAYWGDMTFFPHLLRLLSRSGVKAEVRFSASSRTFTDHKLAASELREQVMRLRG